MIVGISGLLLDEEGNPVGSAGSGKDSFADALVSNANGVKISFADPLKRTARDVYRFTDHQLWGPSQARNEPDKRYPRNHTWVESKSGKSYSCACCGEEVGRNGGRPDDGAGVQCFLTPRYALQILGTSFGRHCYEDTWVNVAVEDAKQVLAGTHTYTQKRGLQETSQSASFKAVAIPDVRFKNEIDGLRSRDAILIRVKRVGKGLSNAAGMHPSERESAEIPDSKFDFVIENNGTLEDLNAQARMVLDQVK